MTSARTRPLVLLASSETADYLASASLIHSFCFPAIPRVPNACQVIRVSIVRIRAQEREETPHARDVYAFPNDINAI